MPSAIATLRVTARVLASVAGAYAVTAGTAALIAVLLVTGAHLSRSDALIIGSTVGYLVFTFLMLWCFAERRLARVWLVLLVAGICCHGGVMLLEPFMPLPGAAP